MNIHIANSNISEEILVMSDEGLLRWEHPKFDDYTVWLNFEDFCSIYKEYLKAIVLI